MVVEWETHDEQPRGKKRKKIFGEKNSWSFSSRGFVAPRTEVPANITSINPALLIAQFHQFEYVAKIS